MLSLCPCFNFTGSRRSNRILPTNSHVLALGRLRNKDLALYRRHKKQQCDAEHRSPVALAKADTKESTKEKMGNSKQEGHSEAGLSVQDSEEEMKEWTSSIITQNNLLPSFMTFDSKRHLSMRAKYADAIQIIALCNVIHETKEEDQATSTAMAATRNENKTQSQNVKKNLSHESFNLGLGPTPKLSTRISKDAVKRNRQKDSQLTFRGIKSPPPPKSLVSGAKPGILKTQKKSKGESRKTGTRNSGKHFHVSSNWLDEDFEENILSYHPKEKQTSTELPQCSAPAPAQEFHGKRRTSIMCKIEPEISEPAVHNIGLFLSAVNEEPPEPKSRTSRFLNIFRKGDHSSASYTSTDFMLYDDHGLGS